MVRLAVGLRLGWVQVGHEGEFKFFGEPQLPELRAPKRTMKKDEQQQQQQQTKHKEIVDIQDQNDCRAVLSI